MKQLQPIERLSLAYVLLVFMASSFRMLLIGLLEVKRKKPEATTITIGKITTRLSARTKSKDDSHNRQNPWKLEILILFSVLRRGLKYFNDYNLSQKEKLEDLNKFNEIKMSLLMNVALSNYKVGQCQKSRFLIQTLEIFFRLQVGTV
jgi:hypothetical protein